MTDMLTPVPRHLALTLLITTACVHVEAGTDAEALGYGPGAQAMLGAGYDPEPVPRPAPTPWTPPSRDMGFAFELEAPGPPEPVPYNDDLVQVCEHLATVVGSEPDLCLQRYRIERVFRTIADWKTLAACLETASDAAAASACERATPRVFGPVAEHPRESEVCMHIFAITIVEQLGAEPLLDAERLGEFEELLHECVNSLVTEERVDHKPTEYEEMLECIEHARTPAAAQACE